MKKFWIFFIVIIIATYISIFSTSLGNENTNEISYVSNTGSVTTNSLNIRSGLSTENAYIGSLNKGDTVNIYGKEDNWYIIKTENNLVGAVCADYIDTSYNPDEIIQTSANIENSKTTPSPLLSQDEQVFFNLINNKRIENNLPEFEIDETLLNLARLKANDIAENKYFSHTSPQYGTIFEMLKNNNVNYYKASENIARNLNADKAIESFMASELHKSNILSEDYNYTGIAVVDSIEFGKIFVQIFVAK